jgi:hypothetical protein
MKLGRSKTLPKAYVTSDKRTHVYLFARIKPKVNSLLTSEFHERYLHSRSEQRFPPEWNTEIIQEYKRWQNCITSAVQRAKGYGETYNQSHDGRWRTLKASAKKRGYEVSITKDDAFRIFDTECSYCGEKPETRLNGIDRVDNKIGYERGNCC